jgi:hypothetical protein
MTESATISLYDYYKDFYGIVIQIHNQPLIEVVVNDPGSSKQIFLIPEFCLLVDVSNDLDDMQLSKIKEAKRLEINAAITPVSELITSIINESESELNFNKFKTLGISLEKSFAKINVKVLDPPRLVFGQE